MKIWEVGQMILGDIWTVCHFADNLPIQSQNELFVDDTDDSSSSYESEDETPLHEAATA